MNGYRGRNSKINLAKMPKEGTIMVTMKDLLECGVHFGHQTRRWNPKMKKFIFGVRKNIYIIDLQKTLRYFRYTYTLVRDAAAEGQTMIFVGTKKQATEAIKKAAQDCGMPYVNHRWLGGMLTNYPTMKKSILKEILSKSSYYFPSARTKAQKLLNEEEAAAQAAAAAQKKLEEEQKAAAAAAAAAVAAAGWLSPQTALTENQRKQMDYRLAIFDRSIEFWCRGVNSYLGAVLQRQEVLFIVARSTRLHGCTNLLLASVHWYSTLPRYY